MLKKALLVFGVLVVSGCTVKTTLDPAAGGVTTTATDTRFEQNTDRLGNDIADMPVGNDPALCAAQCEANPECKAWTWVRPGAEDTARCYLKNPVPEAGPAECCVSGLRGAR